MSLRSKYRPIIYLQNRGSVWAVPPVYTYRAAYALQGRNTARIHSSSAAQDEKGNTLGAARVTNLRTVIRAVRNGSRTMDDENHNHMGGNSPVSTRQLQCKTQDSKHSRLFDNQAPHSTGEARAIADIVISYPTRNIERIRRGIEVCAESIVKSVSLLLSSDRQDIRCRDAHG